MFIQSYILPLKKIISYELKLVKWNAAWFLYFFIYLIAMTYQGKLLTKGPFYCHEKNILEIRLIKICWFQILYLISCHESRQRELNIYIIKNCKIFFVDMWNSESGCWKKINVVERKVNCDIYIYIELEFSRKLESIWYYVDTNFQNRVKNGPFVNLFVS